MTTTPRFASFPLIALAAAVLFTSTARAQSTPPSIFVRMGTSQVASGATPTAATTTTIAAPGSGWTYSAAAPVAGTTWNSILRPNPLIGSNQNSTKGQYVCNSANGISLTSSTGTAAVATLTVTLDIQDLEANTTRVEPNTGAGGNTILGPNGLMNEAWRIYRGGNASIHRIAGLTPGRNYFLYVYASTTTAGQGCRFTLDAANVPGGNGVTTSFIETRGAAGGNVFTTSGAVYLPTTPAVANVASTSSDTTTWGRIQAVVDSAGAITFRTGKNSTNSQFYNGYQLIPFPLPVISVQPPATPSVTLGSNITITTTVTGEGPFTYRWRKGGVNLSDGPTGTGSSISGATTASLTITGVTSGDPAAYDLVVTNAGGSVTSSASVLTMSGGAIPPSFVSQPTSTTALSGATASFSATVNGTSPLTFQWQRSYDNTSFSDLAGQTATTLTLNSVTLADVGYYRLVVTSGVGAVTSNVVTLVLPPVITTQPATAVVPPGSAHTVSVAATAGPGAPEPITYAWKRDGATITNGSGISGALTASLSFASFSAALSGYYTVTASTSAGSVTSTAVYVGVPSTQSVTLAPANNATGIAIDQQLRLVFPSAPKLGKAGTLTIRDAATDAVVVTIDRSQFVTFSLFSATIDNALTRTVQGTSYFYMPIAVYGNEVWVTLSPTQRLAYGKTYYVNIDPALLLDSTNAAYPGVSGTTNWRFSTKAAGPAAPTASTGPTTITVGHDGTGDFATLQGASDWIPQNNTLPRTIVLKPGIYRDNATFAQGRNFVTITGESEDRTASTLFYPYAALSSANDRGAGTLRLESNDITVRDLTLDNGVYVAQPSSGAPAFAGPINTVYATGSRLVFDRILMKGGQDTLYANSGSEYFYGCEIWGSVDFIYGSALTVFDNCDIIQIRSTGGPITAPSTALAQPYGEVFLNCRFPRALVANGYPYDVGVGTTTFMRPWRQDGHTAIINCALGSHFSTKGWSEWVAAEGNKEVTCRAREYGTTQIGGGAVTVAQRQAAGAYWLNTIDPDYVSGMLPSDALLAPSTGTGNRVSVTVNPADYTLSAIFGHPYFALNGWMPPIAPRFTNQPTSTTVAEGASLYLSFRAFGTPSPTCQWYKDGVALPGKTATTLNITPATLADAGAYTAVVTNSAGTKTSAVATVTVTSPLLTWATSFGITAATVSAPGFLEDDTDGDGVPNVLEFLLGGNPTASDAAVLPGATIVSDVGGTSLVFSYNRSTAAVSVIANVETSADLAAWTPVVDGVTATVVSTPLDAQRTRVTVTIPYAGQRLYARVTATR